MSKATLQVRKQQLVRGAIYEAAIDLFGKKGSIRPPSKRWPKPPVCPGGLSSDITQPRMICWRKVWCFMAPRLLQQAQDARQRSNLSIL